VRRLRQGVPVLVGVIAALAFPPLLLVWAAILVRRRVTTGSWGVTLAFLSRSGRRAFVVLAGVGLVGVSVADVSAVTGHGGGDFAGVIGLLVALGLFVLVATDVVFGGAIVAADAATRRGRRR
jgi:hypothetical protein